jgi:hypothetical protein
MSKTKLFYVVYVGDGYDYDKLGDAPNLSNEQFKEIAEDQGHVYTAEELCAEWNSDSLPTIDSYVRHLN